MYLGSIIVVDVSWSQCDLLYYFKPIVFISHIAVRY